MYAALSPESLEARIGTKYNAVRGFEDRITEAGIKTYVWVENLLGQRNIAVLPTSQIEHQPGKNGFKIRDYLRSRWVKEEHIFGTQDIADKFYEILFDRCLPANTDEKQKDFYGVIGGVIGMYNHFFEERNGIYRSMPTRIAKEILQGILGFFSDKRVVIATLGTFVYLGLTDTGGAVELINTHSYFAWIIPLVAGMVGAKKIHKSVKQLKKQMPIMMENDPVLGELYREAKEQANS